MYKGITHAHSTYSDGEYTLAELREVFTAAGCRFACMTDHAEFFDEAKLRQYVAECDALSDATFRFVAGLEYECERRMHVLGFGVTTLTRSTDPQEVIAHIERAGGISVIAHPMNEMFSWIESFDVLPRGIETWNSKYDGQYAPRPGTFELLRRLQKRAPEMRAFYGQDLHWRRQPRVLFNLVEAEALTRDAILGAFRRGAYTATKGEHELSSSGVLDEALLARFGEINGSYMRRQRLFKRVKKLGGRFGKSLPAPIKAQIRRIFS
jgi:predicted metal-dependent phosphoesterase TrpH